MKIVLRVLFIPLCITFFSSLAQEKKILPSSPEASGLLKFVNYPVNYSTGIPDISIDLFEVKAGDVTLPIKISYHSGGGIKANERSTWVGLGWQLSADPGVTRIVNSNPDNSNYGYLNNTNEISNLAQVTKQYLESMINGGLEEDPDEFYFKLGSKGGKFYLIKQANGYHTSNIYDALTIPYEPVVIKYTNNQFSVKDIDGTMYNFGGGDLYETSGTGDVGNQNQTSWKCSNVISASKKDTISFAYYSPDSQQNNLAGVEKYIVYDSLASICSLPTSPGSNGLDAYGYQSFMYGNRWFDIRNLGSGLWSVISPDHPEESSPPWLRKDSHTQVQDARVVSWNRRMKKVWEIKYRAGKVQFYKHQTWNLTALDSICVLDYNNKIIKTIRFHYSHLADLESIRLDSLVIKSASGMAVERYSFDYNAPSIAMPYDVYARTKWTDPCGYFNGYPGDLSANSVPYLDISLRKNCWEYTNGPSYPSYSFSQSIGTFYQPNEAYMQTYILRKINYPTGGRAEFTYEPNQVRGEYPNNSIIKNTSGLRISTIKFFSDNSNNATLEKSYKYGVNEDGAGHPQDYPRFPNNYMYQQTVVYPTSLTTYTERKRTYCSKPFNKLFFSNGAPVLYSQVTEYQKDKGKQSGKTVYIYNNHDITESTTYDNTPLSRERSQWDKGQLLAEIQYGYVNGKYVWVRKRETGYDPSPKGSVNVGKAHNYTEVVYDPAVIQGHVADNYKSLQHFVYTLYSGKMLVSWQTDSTRNMYDTLQTIGVKKTFYYDNPQSTFANRIVNTDSKGNVVTEYVFYPQDYPPNGFNIALLNANMLTYEMERVSTLTPVGATSPVIIDGLINTYSAEGYKTTEEQLEIAIPKGLSEFKFSNTALGLLPESSADQVFAKDPKYAIKNQYTVYDDRGNICQVISKKKIITSYIWGYKKLYPIAQVHNALYKDVFYTGFEEEGNSMEGDCRTGRKSRTTGYSKSMTGLTNGAYLLSYWKKTGALEWSYITTPVTVSANSYTISLSDQIDDVRFHPAAAHMNTYTYDPLVGVTSVTDAKGLITMYEYDASGRLSFIKDLNGNIVKQFQYHYDSQN